MQPEELKQAIQKIKMWQRGGERSPHKPLLLLYAQGRLARGVFMIIEKIFHHVAENTHGTKSMDEWLMRYHGQEICKPRRPDKYTKESFINWHVKEVFKGQGII